MKPLLIVALLMLAASARAQIRTAPKLKAADSAKLLRLRTPAPATAQPTGGAKPVQPVMTGTIFVPTTMVQAAPAPTTPPVQNPPAPPPTPTTTSAPPPFVPTPELIRSYNWPL